MGCSAAQVELKITDDASNQDTVVSDYTRLITQDKVDLLLGTFSSLLNFPASAVAEKNGMLFVEPAGGAPDMFTRGFKYLIYAQPALAPTRPMSSSTGSRACPEAERPKTAAYPIAGRSVRPPGDREHAEAARGARHQDGLLQGLPGGHGEPADRGLGDRRQEARSRRAQGAVFEDGVSLVRALRQVGFSPKALFQTSAPSNADQYSKGIGEANTEGVFYTVSWNEKAATPLNKEFVAAYAKKYDNEVPAEDAADAFAAAQILQKAVEEVGKIDQEALAEWLHANEVETILGPLTWDERGAAEERLHPRPVAGRWRAGRRSQSAATIDKVVYPKPDWK